MIRNPPAASPPFGPPLGKGFPSGSVLRSRAARWIQVFHLNGWIIYSILALYILVTLRLNLKSGVFGNFWLLLSSFVTPTTHTFAVAIIGPWVWRVRTRGGRFLAFVQKLLFALLCTEATAVLISLLDIWMRQKAGFPTRSPAGIVASYLIVVGPVITITGGLIATRANAMEEKEAMREEATIARTRLLQSQLHPHVLFNALNGLAELIHKDPPSAELCVKHLADLLRRILRASETPTFSLGEERALVDDYLFIEGLRLGHRLRLHWDWDASLDGQQVPPLLIQPLVENAIKHGIAPNRSGGDLIVRVRRRGPDLTMEVWNTGAPYIERPGGGIGLKNLEARLALHFGQHPSFSIRPFEEGTLASISLPGVLLH